jgi:hypothetical protein
MHNLQCTNVARASGNYNTNLINHTAAPNKYMWHGIVVFCGSVFCLCLLYDCFLAVCFFCDVFSGSVFVVCLLCVVVCFFCVLWVAVCFLCVCFAPFVGQCVFCVFSKSFSESHLWRPHHPKSLKKHTFNLHIESRYRKITLPCRSGITAYANQGVTH